VRGGRTPDESELVPAVGSPLGGEPPPEEGALSGGRRCEELFDASRYFFAATMARATVAIKRVRTMISLAVPDRRTTRLSW
jgi:hypothetical protein